MGNLFLNYFSLGAAIPSVFTLLIGIFFLTLKNASRPARAVGILTLLLGVFNGAYVMAAAWYHPNAAWHRWLTVGSILPIEAFVAHFMLHFPVVRWKKHSSKLLFVQLFIALAMLVFFISQTWQADTIYHFDGHYWDFAADKASRIVGVVILLYALFYTGLGVWQAILCKGEQRWAAAGVTAGMFIASIIPAVLNTLSRSGLMDRGTFQTSWDVLALIGFFVFVIVFINNTRDRTTFMAKIVSTALLTFLLVFQSIAMVSFSDREESYNNTYRQISERAVESGFRTSDMRYVVRIPLPNPAAKGKNKKQSSQDDGQSQTGSNDKDGKSAAGQPEFLLQPEEDGPRLSPGSLYNTYLYQSILDSEGSGQYRKALRRTASVSRGYKKLLRKSGLEEPAEAARYLLEAGEKNEYHRRKIHKLPSEGFVEQLNAYLDQNEALASYAVVIRKSLKNREGEQARRIALDHIQPVLPVGERHYRMSPAGDVHYTAFTVFDKEGTLHEIGYDYRTYRAFIHPTGFKLSLILAAILLITLFALPVFFRGSLTKPLETLIEGVEKVNDGDLETQIPIKVEDEIGFLSRSFNTMVTSIRTAQAKLAEYAETLEEKVKLRTAELEDSLHEIQALKQQQDGDYFLTSLLTTPMTANYVDSDTVSVEFIMEQKKKFQFRKWEKDIGGDVSIAHTLELGGKEYTLFLNADAMGKSMQGAGGVIVLGSVFQTILQRTRYSNFMNNITPERWMKSVFVELHRTFESFDGSMLISVVMGLIDNKTGFLYYMNAEHPYTILYRDKSAQFLEDGFMYRKLGTQGMEGDIQVATFQLEPGDVLIAGSDGRDDIMLGTTSDGERIINEDETLILRVVRQADTDLKEIKELLLGEGELTDDFSLVRIGYQEEPMVHSRDPEVEKKATKLLRKALEFLKKNKVSEAASLLDEAYKLDTNQPQILKYLVKTSLMQKDYKLCADYADQYIHLRPHDVEFIYIASFCRKMVGDYDGAISLGESLRIRSEDMIKNLINLGDAYLLNGNVKRAEKIIKRAVHSEPDNPLVQRLKQTLTKQKA
jgi:HAMP domain-containing protein